MGIFSSKTKTIVSVASMVYNLIGDTDIDDCMKQLIFKYIMDNPPYPMGIGDYIKNLARSNPANNIKNYIKWCRQEKYNEFMGIIQSDWIYGSSIDTKPILDYLYKINNIEPDTEEQRTAITIESVNIGNFDYNFYVDAYLKDNPSIVAKPETPNPEYPKYEGYTYYVLKPNKGDTKLQVKITFSFYKTDFFNRKYYVYVYKDIGVDISQYSKYIDSKDKIFLYVSYNIVILKTPSEETPELPEDFEKIIKKSLVYVKGSGEETLDRLFKTDTVVVKDSMASHIPFRVWNHNITLDTDKEVYDVANKATIKALGVGKYKEIGDQIFENEDIGQIDFAYLSFGIPINTHELWAKEYLWEYFQGIRKKIGTSSSIIGDGKTYHPYTNDTSNQQYYNRGGKNYIRSTPTKYINNNFDIDITWNGIYSYIGIGKIVPNARRGDIFLGRMKTSYETGYAIICRRHIQNDRAVLKYYRIDYPTIWSVTTPIVYSFDRKKDTLKSTKTILPEIINHNDYTMPEGPNILEKYSNQIITKDSWEDVVLIKQIYDNVYEMLVISDLQYTNYIYKGHYDQGNPNIYYYGWDEIVKYPKDKKYSGFIIPIELNTFSRMRLNSAINCMQVGNNILFNCYEVRVVKIKWYQTGFFKIFISIIAIAISVVITVISMGSASPIAAGIVSAAMTTGSALGFAAGTLACAIAGAIANAILGIILVNILAPVMNGIFGDIIGPLLTTIVSIVFMSYALSGFQSLSSSITNVLSSPKTYLSCISAIKDGYANYIQDKMEDLQANANAFKDYTQKKEEELQEAYSDLYAGMMDGSFVRNVILGRSNSTKQYIAEDPDEFFARTLITGDEIVDKTQNIAVYNFVDIMTTLPGVV